jgi:hypothetical protein
MNNGIRLWKEHLLKKKDGRIGKQLCIKKQKKLPILF